MKTEDNEADALRHQFETSLWLMLAGSDDEDLDDITERTVDLMSKRIIALSSTSIEVLQAKTVVAYFWAQDGAGTLERDRQAGCIAERAKADLLIAAAEVLVPEFKGKLDEWLAKAVTAPIAA